ncbi:MAG: hypothetical protein R3E61_06340 [Pseudomonadales bacterium]
MDAPDFVPEAAKAYLSVLLLDDDSRLPMSWRTALASAEKELAALKSNNDATRREITEAQTHRDELAENVACLERLVQDDRMKEPYQLLSSEFTEDKQWEGFIHAAWAAQLDYSKYRDRVKRGVELSKKIAQKAEELAKLIHQIRETGIILPDEFLSMNELLMQTDSGEQRTSDRDLWRGLKKHVLGSPPERQEVALMPNPPAIKIEFVSAENAKISLKEKDQINMRYIWNIAPSLPSCLGTLANAARRFEPRETKAIDAAIQTRQRSIKTEYIRAFAKIMAEYQVSISTTKIMKAMAMVANVVINRPDVDVSYDDVRKALQERP